MLKETMQGINEHKGSKYSQMSQTIELPFKLNFAMGVSFAR